LLHGWPGDSRHDYRSVIPLLEGELRVVAPDLRGFGESDRHLLDPDTFYSPSAQARSIAGLIDELGLVRPVLAGYDVGSRVALLDRWPDPVQRGEVQRVLRRPSQCRQGPVHGLRAVDELQWADRQGVGQHREREKLPLGALAPVQHRPRTAGPFTRASPARRMRNSCFRGPTWQRST
jgi:pimeloyl-ACP methyl ester carboxylesterase